LGAVPNVFDEARPEWAGPRQELRELLGEREYDAARRSTINAHFTDAALVKEIWRFAEGMGFEGGRVLEPGCGSGNFIGLAPAVAEITGVELDPTTAAIAKQLYPGARVLNESFADTRIASASFDLVVGNVPFGRVSLHDPRYNPQGHSIHNHFLLKSLELTRPGGLVLALSSRYTLDAANPAARREMAELADLVAAVRLPGGAHRQAAGTEVVTDLLVLRRREAGAAPRGEAWERALPEQLGDGSEVTINEVFQRHPDWLLGDLVAQSGPFGPELGLQARADTVGELEAALEAVASRASSAGLVMDRPSTAAQPEVRIEERRLQRSEGYISAAPDGGFNRVVDGTAQEFAVRGERNARELRQLLGVRDVLVELLETEAQSRDDVPRMAELRTALNDRYDRYVGHYGPVNRFTWAHSGRFDPITGEEKMRRLRPAQGGFRLDTYAPAVMALEEFDAVSQRASKASVFQRRAVAPRVRRLGADSPADALAICLDERGTVDLDEIGRLLGSDPQAARLALGSLVFEEPGAERRLVAAAEYLSGDVRAKLAVAEAASREDPRWVENASALRAVVPAELGPGEIDARLGATWIGASDVQLFLRQTLEDPHLVVEHPGASTWTVRGNSYGVAATVRWGTARAPAARLAQALLEQRQISIHDELDGGGRTLNLTDTTAAREKAEELNERFSAWVWEDPERSSRLSKHYNDLFNGSALRSYDGAELSLPGMAEAFEPASHQVAAVARIVAEPTVLLAHDVGAGKTAEMVIGSQELRRLGLVKKPGFVVPNHMLEQFGREFLQIYPRARVLVADKDAMAGPNRREFVARSATGDWDAVILSRSACERIPMSAASRRDYIDAELAVVRRQLAAARDGDRRTVKRIERELLAAEERLKGKLNTERRDAGVSWEQTGIDYLFVDEAHGYKNLRTASNIQGAAIDGSQRADDLAMKLHYLRQTHGHRVVTFATATPIANSVTETYVVQRYLQPDLLARAGIEDFDSWAANFGRVVTEVELAPAGNEYRLQSRFARFRNVPELLRLLHVSADVKTAEDLKLARPAVAGSGPETVVVECSQELAAYGLSLVS